MKRTHSRAALVAGCGWFTRVVVLAVLIGAAPRVLAQTPSMHDMPASDPASAPSRLAWSGFADTVWQKGNEPGEPNTFSLGQFTLYPTPTLADNLSMLAEVVVEAEFRHHDVTGTSGFNAFAANVSFTF